MRKENRMALLVGIDHYCLGIKDLSACGNDVKNIARLLETHANGDANFDCRQLVSTDKTNISAAVVKRAIKLMLNKEPEMALFYFSGHGYASKNEGGFLVCQDTPIEKPEKGYRMNQLLDDFYRSSVPEIVVVLDCCHSGFIGDVDHFHHESALVRKGVSVLSASRYNELAVEKYGQGVFTKILCEGLAGKAADQWGNVTASSLYAWAEHSLSPWQQRPTFRSFVSQVKSIRSCNPK